MAGVIVMVVLAAMAAVAMGAVFTELYATITEEIVVAKAMRLMAEDEEVTGEQAYQFMLAMAAR